MWLQSTPTTQFRWFDGRSYNIKTIKPIETFDKTLPLQLRTGDKLDEVASRNEIFGVGREDLSYLLFGANIVKLVENKFDLSKLKELRIPIV
jgi:hypothetical protein